jgi:hypothetical protein
MFQDFGHVFTSSIIHKKSINRLILHIWLELNISILKKTVIYEIWNWCAAPASFNLVSLCDGLHFYLSHLNKKTISKIFNLKYYMGRCIRRAIGLYYSFFYNYTHIFSSNTKTIHHTSLQSLVRTLLSFTSYTPLSLCIPFLLTSLVLCILVTSFNNPMSIKSTLVHTIQD